MQPRKLTTMAQHSDKSIGNMVLQIDAISSIKESDEEIQTRVEQALSRFREKAETESSDQSLKEAKALLKNERIREELQKLPGSPLEKMEEAIDNLL